MRNYFKPSNMLRCAAALALGGLVAAGCAKAAKEAKMQESKGGAAQPAGEKGLYATFVTSKGDIVVKLFPKEAPKTVENFVELATGKKRWLDPKTRRETTRPLYNGTIFHRVIPGFMIQGGDPLGTGAGGPGYRFADEFYPGRSFEKPGILAMANAGPNTNGSQFFITVAPTPWLNNRHTIFGEVVEGLKVVEAIVSVPRGANDRPNEPQVLKEVRIEEK